MGNYVALISVKDGELDEIMAELKEAQEKIYKCYNRLDELGVLRIEKETPPDAAGLLPKERTIEKRDLLL